MLPKRTTCGPAVAGAGETMETDKRSKVTGVLLKDGGPMFEKAEAARSPRTRRFAHHGDVSNRRRVGWGEGHKTEAPPH